MPDAAVHGSCKESPRASSLQRHLVHRVMPTGKQPRSLVADVVDFENRGGRQLVLEAEVPVLHVGQAAGIARGISDTLSVRKRWILVRQNRR